MDDSFILGERNFSMSGPLPDLGRHGLESVGNVNANLPAAALIEQALRRREGELTADGSLVVFTGKYTGRSPGDKFIVKEAGIEGQIDWGKVNKPMAPDVFSRLLDAARAYVRGRELFVQDAFACADARHRLTLRVVAEKAWHALFSQCLFLRPSAETFEPEWLVLSVPELKFDAARHGTASEAVIAVSFERKTVLIAGTHYAGEIKKSIFTILNGLLPQRNVLPMHCSANIGRRGEVTLFFGLSGTGKTTLSADPERRLIGDDEHGWSDDGVFNIEGGCYAKTIRLSQEGEPQIWNAIRFGSVLENVPIDPRTRVPDFNSEKYTENTRAAYPVDFIPNAERSGRGGLPTNVVFLTCDAFGVLPPIARLTCEQAMQYFLSGYTAKVAGTEAGVKEPTATFSTCFAAPFLPLPPRRYAELLRERLSRFKVPVWLLNTGWTGGPHGVGKRMSLPLTRAMLHAALEGLLNDVPYTTDPIFGVQVPLKCPGVPDAVLQPRLSWSDSAAYDAAARKLADMFRAEWLKYTV
jgi:phosphoenolpyruvate carboxykinase (ATP)